MDNSGLDSLILQENISASKYLHGQLCMCLPCGSLAQLVTSLLSCTSKYTECRHMLSLHYLVWCTLILLKYYHILLVLIDLIDWLNMSKFRVAMKQLFLCTMSELQMNEIEDKGVLLAVAILLNVYVAIITQLCMYMIEHIRV